VRGARTARRRGGAWHGAVEASWGVATAWVRRVAWDGGPPRPVVASGADAEGRDAATLRPTP
jgi:hypothetical protein